MRLRLLATPGLKPCGSASPYLTSCPYDWAVPPGPFGAISKSPKWERPDRRSVPRTSTKKRPASETCFSAAGYLTGQCGARSQYQGESKVWPWAKLPAGEPRRLSVFFATFLSAAGRFDRLGQ